MEIDLRSSTFEKVFVRWRRPFAVLIFAISIVFIWSVYSAPVDETQGIIQKIFYLHVPCAFAAYLGFLSTAIAGGLYLWKRDISYDRIAGAAAEVGVLFCTFVIITGPIWARGTWGRWWSWDLRLTLTLLLFLTYVSYLLLRSFIDSSERAARFSAIYGILGLAIIPLNYFAIDLAGGRTIHPENLGAGSLGDGMMLPFILGIVTIIATYLYLFASRSELGLVRDRAERNTLEVGER